MKTRIIIFLAGIFGVVGGCKNIFTRSDPFEGTVRMLEKSGGSKYDYFKLSKGVMLPYAYYMENKITNSISSVVYPLVSAEYLDSIDNVYLEKHTAASYETEFPAWFDSVKTKPAVYVISKEKNLNLRSLNQLLETDTAEKNISGTRMTSFSDLDDEVKDALESSDITPDNAIFVEEGNTPAHNHGFGWISMIVGVLVTIGSLISLAYKLLSTE